jgi:tryptophan-rich sensory protein
MSIRTIVLFIDFLGILIGLLSVAKMIGLKKTLGGRLGTILNLVVVGVSLNILAFAWTVIFTRLKLLPAPSLDVHHLLMTFGMILFVLAAKKFSSIAQPQ